MSESTSGDLVTIAPAKRFTIEFYLSDDSEDEMGFHLAEGMAEALPGILATRCIGVEEVGFIAIEFIKDSGRHYLTQRFAEKLFQGNLEHALSGKTLN